MFSHSIVNEQSIYDVHRSICYIVQSACNALWSLYKRNITNILKNYAKEFFENIIESKNIKTRKKT